MAFTEYLGGSWAAPNLKLHPSLKLIVVPLRGGGHIRAWPVTAASDSDQRTAAAAAARPRFRTASDTSMGRDNMLGLHKVYMDLTKVYIMALNLYLHAFHTCRAEALRVPEIQQLNTMSSNALKKLQTVLQYGVR
jgi:hypothetical protein